MRVSRWGFGSGLAHGGTPHWLHPKIRPCQCLYVGCLALAPSPTADHLLHLYFGLAVPRGCGPCLLRGALLFYSECPAPWFSPPLLTLQSEMGFLWHYA